MSDIKFPMHLKSNIYCSVISTVLLYDCEDWPMTKRLEQIFHTIKMRMISWSIDLTKLGKARNTDKKKTKKLDIAQVLNKIIETHFS